MSPSEIGLVCEINVEIYGNSCAGLLVLWEIKLNYAACFDRQSSKRSIFWLLRLCSFLSLNGECRVLLCSFSDKSCEGRKTFLLFSHESSTFITKRFESFLLGKHLMLPRAFLIQPSGIFRHQVTSLQTLWATFVSFVSLIQFALILLSTSKYERTHKESYLELRIVNCAIIFIKKSFICWPNNRIIPKYLTLIFILQEFFIILLHFLKLFSFEFNLTKHGTVLRFPIETRKE